MVFLWKTFLHLLQYFSDRNELPSNVKQVYDPAQYRQWKAYHHEKCRLTMISDAVMFAVLFTLYVTDAYAAFAGLFPQNDDLQAFSVLFLNTLASVLCSLPFSWVDTFRIEEKFGFNKSTRKIFISDTIKETLLGLLLSVVLTLLYIRIDRLGDMGILIFALCLILLIFVISFLAPLFTRIFNHFTPLEEGELREKLSLLLTSHGYSVRGIFVMDASRRTTKANAYFTGFGKSKEIVLYDTLISSFTPDEICAVFSHELGHGLNKDTLHLQLISSLMMITMAVMIWFTARTEQISTAFGFAGVNYGLCMLLVSEIEMELVQPFIGLIRGAYSRKAEFRADRQAVLEGYGPDLISGLIRLTRDNLSDLSPSPLLVRLTYDHPPLSARIKNAQEILAQKRKEL